MVQSLTGQEPERLELGASGEWVLTLQIRLYLLGYFADWPDATYDMRTESAVRMVQSERGLDNDGEATVAVWEAILYLEQQASIDYYWSSPYAALEQIRYDLDHPANPAGQLSEDGQHQWDGTQWQPVDGAGTAPQVSEDGQWEWDGTQWQPAGTSVAAHSTGGNDGQDHAGQLSEDGQWRWNGTEWVAATGGESAGQASASQDYAGQLSEDGQWRWNGTEWVAA